MAVNYNDERFAEVEAEKQAALNEIDVAYGNMIGSADQYYNEAIDAAKDYADKQAQIQQEQTDFAIEQIEQQKDFAHKDYIKEQSGAYVDWQKQSNEFGVQAEQMAAMGMTGTGFNESSKVSMYNTYQNRVATAREAYTRAVLNYDNAIKDARLQNNAALAEIAYKALQTQLELSIEGFQYKNTLIMNQISQKQSVNNEYYSRYQDVLQQINTENALAEEIRQFNESLAEEQRQFNVAQANKGSGGGGGITIDKTDNSPTVDKTANGNSSLDMNSVLALGYGPISASNLAAMVNRGQITMYEENGVTKVRKNSGYQPKNTYKTSGASNDLITKTNAAYNPLINNIAKNYYKKR